MKINDALQQSFRACEGAALALAHVLRPLATKHDPPQNVLTAYQEAQAFSITCRAVMDEAAPLFPHLTPTSRCAGKFLGLTSNSKSDSNNNNPATDVNNAAPSSTARENSQISQIEANSSARKNTNTNNDTQTHNDNTNRTDICNGYDSLAVVLIMLFDNATQAILDVAANHSRWLVTPLQASVCFDRMVTHHGQLRGFYGIVHLACRISAHTPDTHKTLFVDIDESTESDMQPSKWRSAIKLDDFYGRHFGFHYTPEMRNVLRVVNIARGSVIKSHNEDDTTPQVIKNAVMLGWGWIYSNMIIMDNLGLPIDGVSKIGADDTSSNISIQQVRKFMNLVEEPLVIGVSGLTSADVAIDTSFDIPTAADVGGLEVSNSTKDDPLRHILDSVTDPVRVRLMSHKDRPINLSHLRNRPRSAQKKPRSPTLPTGERRSSKAVESEGVNGVAQVVSSIDIVDDAHVPETEERSDTSKPVPIAMKQNQIPAKSGDKNSNVTEQGESGMTTGATSSSAEGKDQIKEQVMQDADRLDNSFLASSIKTEFKRLQSNVSSFLGIEEKKPATGLVVYFHGGGFISQSSESHLNYLKEWCHDVSDCVVLSIDYKLAPEYKFPVALHECVYAYMWALQNASSIGTLCERVVFAGDSAGGNLAVTTALKVEQLGIRGPDGICTTYPALYLTSAWSPSRLLAFFDPMLPVSVLELCLKSYVPDDVDGTTHPLVSPIKMSDDHLRALPPVTIVCGSLDPLLDDAAVFAQRLHDLRSGDTFKVVQSLPHGFLNMSQVNETARAGMRFMAKMMAQYLNVPLKRRNESEEDKELRGHAIRDDRLSKKTALRERFN